MNQRSLSDIKRRLNPDKRSPGTLRGCYVAADGHIISTFTETVDLLTEAENEKYMAIFRKCLSGTMGQNLLDIRFTNEQVDGGEPYRVLSRLRSSALKDDEAFDELCREAITWITAQAASVQSVDEMNAMPNYAILALEDKYDIRFRDKNGEIDNDRSTAVFSYFLCAVCPVKQGKPVLAYDTADGGFRGQPAMACLGLPEMGFLFPAMEDGSADIYGALYYTRNAADMHDAFVENVFATPVYMPASEQKDTFRSILSEALGDECSLEVVQTMQETVAGLIDDQKADKNAEPLLLGKENVAAVLAEAGVSQEKTDAFREKYTETFGEDAALPAVNLVTPRQFSLSTPSVSIKVDPEHSDLVETRIIDGKSYIMILADGAVEVNGVTVNI